MTFPKIKYDQLTSTLVPLPCPFCGKSPILLPTDSDNEGDAWGEVRCVNFACPVKPYVQDQEEVNDCRGTGAYQDCAIRLWNTRK